MRVPAIRVRALRDEPVRPGGECVLYWMVAARRAHHSFALQRAVEHARALGRPLIVLEALRVGYRWASDRLHAFVLQGMADNARALADAPVTYLPYVEPAVGAGQGLLEALAARAAVVVTDDSPAFFLPRLLAAAATRLRVRLEAVDGNGLLPLRAATRDFSTAYAFRRFLQAALPPHLAERPAADPLRGLDLPLLRPRLPRWPRASEALLAADPAALAALPIDHEVRPVATRGGAEAGRAALARFLDERLPRYAERSHPDAEASSGLSPWLHFGHVSVHEVLARLAAQQGWTAPRGGGARGAREGWWGMSAPAEAFLDELVTWRELALSSAARAPEQHERYGALPAWARRTLEAHAGDPRPHRYGLDALAAARTADPVWNAAQTELVTEGRLHNYLRMLWGKRILEWTPTPARALEVMIELNNRYALDGRDPSSSAGFHWVLGRYDRPWAPERKIFGRVRYMSSASTVKKLRMKRYLARYERSAQRAQEARHEADQLELVAQPRRAGQLDVPDGGGHQQHRPRRRR